MFITQKQLALPVHSELLGDPYVVWPFVEVAIDSDLFVVELYLPHARPAEHNIRTYLLNLEHCGEALRSFTLQGAEIRHAAILPVRMAGSPDKPFKIATVTKISLGQRAHRELDIAVLTLDAGETVTLPSWAGGEVVTDQITLFSGV